MRLDLMLVRHLDQDNSRVCARCGEPVGIYPSGQDVLRRWPETPIICNLCMEDEPPCVTLPAPGALEEARRG